MIDIKHKIQNEMPYLKPALAKIGIYILEHPMECRSMSIKELAMACHVADSTVTRFVKEVGLSNYQELKLSLTAYTAVQKTSNQTDEKGPYLYEGIRKTDNTNDIIDKVYNMKLQAMEDCRKRIHLPSLEKAGSMLATCDEIYFTCIGSSGVAAQEAIMRFSRAGKRCIFWKDIGLSMMSAATLSQKDVVIAISESGSTEIVIDNIRIARSVGAKVIAITSKENSVVAQMADVVLLTPKRIETWENALEWESAQIKSAQIFVMDVLYSCYAVHCFDETVEYMDKTYLAVKKTRR